MLPVKFVRGDSSMIEGVGCPFGGHANGRDSHGEAFTASTDFALSWFPERPLLMEHGMAEMGMDPIGRVVGHEMRDAGLWVRCRLDTASKCYRKVQRLIDDGALYFSSGSVRHLVETDPTTGIIKKWPLVEMSLVDHPANYHATLDWADAAKHYAAAGLKFSPPTPDWADAVRSFKAALRTAPPKPQRYYFRAIPFTETSDLMQIRASKALELCQERLNMPFLKVCFVLPHPGKAGADFAIPEDWLGWQDDGQPNLAFIRADVDEDCVMSLVCHECRHCWQSDLGWDSERREADAEEWAAMMVRSLENRN